MSIFIYLTLLLFVAHGAWTAYLPYSTDELDRFNSQDNNNIIALQMNSNEEENSKIPPPPPPHPPPPPQSSLISLSQSHHPHSLQRVRDSDDEDQDHQLYQDNSLYGLITNTNHNHNNHKDDHHLSYKNTIDGGGGNLRKRYPTHLDPFLQAKLWFRSGVAQWAGGLICCCQMSTWSRFYTRLAKCPRGGDGAALFFCPLPTKEGTWNCVDDHQLCDGVKHCPHADDESPLVCMFYKAMQSQINFVANGISSQSMKSEPDYAK